ncbi:MAG: ATP-binding cassette domain-containing protein [Limnobacter sp.]|nr:ATP-binding cassette domain-containing protein [Limnobacter sp.]
MAASARVKALNEVHSVAVIGDLLTHAGAREDLGEGQALSTLQGDLTLHNLHYAYDNDGPALAGVNATFPFGKTTLLAGPSGSGKSTLLDILLRLEEPQSGSIQAMGVAASDYRLADWRKQFGYVSQEAALFNGDIRMNLRLAHPTASDAEVEQACRLAGADSFIRELPNGYDTLVGDRGYSLSGGQRKRIAIARALIRKPAVLILDEATTSFEQSLEQSMLGILRSTMPHMTIVQVTHRLPANRK